MTLVVTVAAPQKVNPNLCVKRSNQTIPLLFSDGMRGGRILAGTLSVLVTSKNAISATFVDMDKKRTTFRGIWSDLDEASGMASTSMTKSGCVVDISLSRDGVLSASLATADRRTLVGEIGKQSTGIFSAYSGNYTVQLPCLDSSTNSLSRGDASLVLAMTSKSYVNNGKMKFNGMLPSGKRISGCAYLDLRTEIDEVGFERQCATLPIFVVSSTESFGALLKISPDAAKTWENPLVSSDLPAVETANGSVAFWRTKKTVERMTFHNVHGAYFKSGATPSSLCEIFAIENAFKFRICEEELHSERWGMAMQTPQFSCKASGKKFSLIEGIGKPKLTYSATTGIVKGSGKIQFDGKTVGGSFKGVVLPGWVDYQCGEGFVERPFASGAFWFTDYVKTSGKWKSVTRSVPFEIAAGE